MWRSGAITEDARLEWDGAEPVPLLEALQQTPHRECGGGTPVIWRIPLALAGGILGLLASFLLRPRYPGESATLGQWLTGGLASGYASTIVICALIGAAMGFIAGRVIEGKN